MRRTLGPRKVKIFIHGEYWDAAADEDVLEPGTPVEVIAVEGMRMRVRRPRPEPRSA